MATDKDKFQLSIVSPEGQMFAGAVDMLLIKGGEGELGITPGHLQLLTSVAPGPATIRFDGQEEILYVAGGILEVQPHAVSILADTVVRPQDVNEAAAREAKAKAEKALASKDSNVDHKLSRDELNQALAKLRVVELMRIRRKHK